MRRTWLGTCVGLLMCVAAQANVRLPAVLSDNMLLQRDVATKFWGWADMDEEVTVTVGDQVLPKVVAEPDGKWLVTLPKFPAGAVPDITVQGRNKLTVKNILAGDVWVCSGQSNMQMSVRDSNDAAQAAAAANYPKIRLFTMPSVVAAAPQEDCKGQWVECSPATIAHFSAVGYFFGRELHGKLNAPMGLINTSWGGTVAEAWTPMPALINVPEYEAILVRDRQYRETYHSFWLSNYVKNLAKWKEDVAKLKAEGKPVGHLGRPPGRPTEPDKNPNTAGVLYNGMIHPLLNYAIKGAVWYQGESNAGRAVQYRQLLPTMIASWRQAWGQGDFPFGIVQLANFTARLPQPGDSNWAELREAQALTAANTPHVGLACIIDIGDAVDIHPKNKQDVGKRLALWALATVYDQKGVVDSGPTYSKMVVEGPSIRLSFAHLGGGLVVKDGAELKGFAIAGEDQKFVWATAKIDGNSVVVTFRAGDETIKPLMIKPVAVRYAWANNPECNLYNKEGLPAVPFRTDDWPVSTQNAK